MTYSTPTRYRVVFASDVDPTFGTPTLRTKRDRPSPMTCSTPAMALRMGSHFGEPIRLVVEPPDGAAGATYDLRGVVLADGSDWPAVIECIRASRRRVTP